MTERIVPRPRLAARKNAAFLLSLASYGSITIVLAGYLASLPPAWSWRLAFLAAATLLFYLCQIRSEAWNRTPATAAVFLSLQTVLASALLILLTTGERFPWALILHFMLASQSIFLFSPPYSLGATVLVYLAATVSLCWLAWPLSLLGILRLAGSLLAGFLFVAVMSHLAVQQFRERERAEKALAELRLSQARLEEAYRSLAAYAREVEDLAATRERNRLAREIHDTLAHALTALVVQLEGCDRLWAVDPQRARENLLRGQELARRGLAEVRRSLRALHSELPAQRPCAQAMAELAAEFQADTGVAVTFQVVGQERPVRPEVCSALYRTLQEALTNAGRHGRARQVSATLTFLPGELRLEVADDGQGAAQVVPGLGLTGMRERLEELHGTLQLSTRPGEGFTVIASLPDP